MLNAISWRRPTGCALLWAILVLAIVGIACGQKGPDSGRQDLPLPDKTIETVLREHTDGLMALPGVVGTAQGECGGRPCIKVFVVEESPELLQKIPAEMDGYAVEVVETGEIKALER